MRKTILSLSILLLFTASIYSYPLAPSEENGRRISFGITSDAFAGLELGYSQPFQVFENKPWHFYARFGVPVLLSAKDRSIDTWELKTGVTVTLFDKNRFCMKSDWQVFLMHHKQVLGTFLPLGINLRLTPCAQFQKGYLGFQMNYHQTIATHITHSQYVKETFNDLAGYDKIMIDIHPKDGWYSGTGSFVSFGLEGGRRINQQLYLYGDFGIIRFSSPFTGMFDAMMMGQVPFYATLRLVMRI